MKYEATCEGRTIVGQWTVDTLTMVRYELNVMITAAQDDIKHINENNLGQGVFLHSLLKSKLNSTNGYQSDYQVQGQLHHPTNKAKVEMFQCLDTTLFFIHLHTHETMTHCCMTRDTDSVLHMNTVTQQQRHFIKYDQRQQEDPLHTQFFTVT